MKKLLAFINNMDAKVWRTVWVSLALVAGVGVLMVLSKTGVLGAMDVAGVEKDLDGLRGSPWALPITIVFFTITSFLFVVPQFALVGACVVAFGPWIGSIYALIGTVASSWLHFYIGRWGGSAMVQRYGGNTLNRLSRFIGRNDFVASMIVRNVPVSAAIVVNTAFGASHARFWPFITGVAVGSIPKIAIVALLGQSVLSALGGGVVLGIGAAIAVGGIWLTMALAARKAVHEDDEPGGEGDNAGGPQSA